MFIPLGASDELVELWRCRVVQFFAARKLINADFARKLLGWKHSGFSIESNTRIYDDKARESLCQSIVRTPGPLAAGQTPKLEIEYRMDTETFAAIASGALVPMKAWRQGKVKVKASLPDMLALQKLA